MSEKLTREEAYKRVSNLITAMNPSDPHGLVRNVHGVIDEYTEAVRAEERAEIHRLGVEKGQGYQIGEQVEAILSSGKWEKAIIVARAEEGTMNTSSWLKVRRPSKKRPLTRLEMMHALFEKLQDWELVSEELLENSVETICRQKGIPTEVDE